MKPMELNWFQHVKTVILDDSLKLHTVSYEHVNMIAAISFATEIAAPFPITCFWVDKRDNKAFRALYVKKDIYNATSSRRCG